MYIFKNLKDCIIPADDCFENILMIMLPLDKESGILSNKEKESKGKCYLGVDYSNNRDGIAYFVKCDKHCRRSIYVEKERRPYINKMAMQGITSYYRKNLKK